MRKLSAVQNARAIMMEGMDWSAWKWLFERRRVRDIADRATAALEAAAKKAKAQWPSELKMAYSQLIASDQSSKANSGTNHGHDGTDGISDEIRLLVKQVKQAEDKAERCRLAAEDMFEEAEQRFSAEMAREGARKALETYDLREAAIRKAETAIGKAQSATP